MVEESQMGEVGRSDAADKISLTRTYVGSIINLATNR